MKKTLVILLLTIFQTLVFAQKKPTKKNVLPPPQIIRVVEKPTPPVPKENPYQAIIKKDEPLAFHWTIEKDSVLAPKMVFEKALDISDSYVDQRIMTTKDSLIIQKGKENLAFTHYVQSNYSTYTIKDNILILTDKKIGTISKFKMTLDAKKTKIAQIQDITTKEIYKPTQFEGASVGL